MSYMYLSLYDMYDYSFAHNENNSPGVKNYTAIYLLFTLQVAKTTRMHQQYDDERALTATPLLNSWSQYGNTIARTGSDIDYAIDISMNSDGTIIAIGANKSANGSVFVYQYNGGTWIQMGSTLKGTNSGSEFGGRISINDAGDLLAVGAKLNNASGTAAAGCGRVYSYDSNTSDWVQMANGMCGVQVNEHFAFRVALSGASTTSDAIVAFSSEKWSNGKGRVFTYIYNQGTNNRWTKLGNALTGDANGDNFCDLALSNDGSTIAIGASSGEYFKVYQYTSPDWILMSSKIYGNAVGDQFGNRLTFSGDGTTLAVSAVKAANGYIKIYKYDNAIADWTERQQMTGESGDKFGYGIELSYDGSLLALSARQRDGNKGCGYVYQYDNVSSAYEQVSPAGDPVAMCGDAAQDYLGRSVQISSDGSIVAFASDMSQYVKVLQGVSTYINCTFYTNVVFLGYFFRRIQ